MSTSVCSPTVRIIAFQAIDPGSTPGKRSEKSSFIQVQLFYYYLTEIASGAYMVKLERQELECKSS